MADRFIPFKPGDVLVLDKKYCVSKLLNNMFYDTPKTNVYVCLAISKFSTQIVVLGSDMRKTVYTDYRFFKKAKQ